MLDVNDVPHDLGPPSLVPLPLPLAGEVPALPNWYPREGGLDHAERVGGSDPRTFCPRVLEQVEASSTAQEDLVPDAEGCACAKMEAAWTG